MSETKIEEATWIRYRHRERLEIEYEVESDPDTCEPLPFVFRGEVCHRIRTIRNLSYPEEVHQPAFTMMPAEGLLDVYERVA